MEKCILSPFVRIITDEQSGLSMVYHALYGNPAILNQEGILLLRLFKNPDEKLAISDADLKELQTYIELFTKNFFLIQPKFDERMELEKIKARHLERIKSRQTVDRMGLAISNFCNLGCKHCMHFKQPEGQISQNSQGQPLKFMSWEIAKECLDRYIGLVKEQSQSCGKVHLGNAEPLLNWEVVRKVLEYCSQIPDLSFEITINTNLLPLTRKKAETLKKYGVHIAASLDGTSVANDAIRVTKTGRGTFDAIIKKFDLLAEIDYPLDSFSVTVTDLNFEQISTDIIDLAVERKMIQVAFDYDLISLMSIPVEQRVAKLISLKRYANSRDIEFYGTWDTAFNNLVSGNNFDGPRYFCAAVEGKSLEFDVDGGIKTCSHGKTTIGQISHFDDLFNPGSGLYQMAESRFPGSDPFCVGCSIEGLCAGQCHVTREVADNETGVNPLFLDFCNFYRQVTNALIIEELKNAAMTA